jgi:putative ABC transport system permease protein
VKLTAHRHGRVPIGRRQLAHEPVKLVLALLGVALAVALVGLLFGLREGINRQVSLFEDHAGADVYVAEKGTRDFPTSGSSALPVSMARQIGAVPGVEEAVPVTNSLGILTLHDKRVATLLVGFEPGRLGRPWEMTAGRRPQRGGEIAIDSVMADAHGLGLGDTVHVRGQPLRVVGLTGETAAWMTPLIFVTRDTANTLEGRGDTARFVLVRGSDPGSLAARIARRFPQLSVMTRDEIRANDRELLSRAFNSPLLVMVLIALGVGALVIGLTTYGFVSDRRREFGSLKAIGERNGRLYRLVTGQAIAIAAVGLAAGVILRIVAGSTIHSISPKFLFVALPAHYVIVVVAALVMGLAGALVPVRVLARLDPQEVFRR